MSCHKNLQKPVSHSNLSLSLQTDLGDILTLIFPWAFSPGCFYADGPNGPKPKQNPEETVLF